MIPRDTSAKAAALQFEAYRRAGAQGRFQTAVELTSVVRSLAEAGIRRRHPEYTPEQVSEELLRVIYSIRRS